METLTLLEQAKATLAPWEGDEDVIVYQDAGRVMVRELLLRGQPASV